MATVIQVMLKHSKLPKGQLQMHCQEVISRLSTIDHLIFSRSPFPITVEKEDKQESQFPEKESKMLPNQLGSHFTTFKSFYEMNP